MRILTTRAHSEGTLRTRLGAITLQSEPYGKTVVHNGVKFFLHPACRFELKPPMTTRKTTPVPACRECGATLQFVWVIRPWISRNLNDTGPPRAPSLE